MHPSARVGFFVRNILKQHSFFFRGFLYAALLSLSQLAAAAGTGLCPATAPSFAQQGIDVSSWQGTIDWTQISASGKTFAYVRAADGSNYIDSKFATNYAAIKTAGMLRGAYQFFEPSQDPVIQANRFLAIVGSYGPGDLPPMLDVETTDGQSAATMIANIQSWVSTIQTATGRTPVIYTSAGFWNANINSTNFGSLPLWIQYWTTTGCISTLPVGWTNINFWHYSDSGTVAGLSPVDLDAYTGTLAELNVLAGLIPDFALTAGTTTLNLQSGQSGAIGLTVTPSNAFSQTVSFSCSGLPAGATCSFSPSTVAPTGSAASTNLTVSYTRTVGLWRKVGCGRKLLG